MGNKAEIEKMSRQLDRIERRLTPLWLRTFRRVSAALRARRVFVRRRIEVARMRFDDWWDRDGLRRDVYVEFAEYSFYDQPADRVRSPIEFDETPPLGNRLRGDIGDNGVAMRVQILAVPRLRFDDAAIIEHVRAYLFHGSRDELYEYSADPGEVPRLRSPNFEWTTLRDRWIENVGNGKVI